MIEEIIKIVINDCKSFTKSSIVLKDPINAQHWKCADHLPPKKG